MDSEAKARSSYSLEFINITAEAGNDRRRNNQIARAHAARVNRQRYKLQKTDQKVREPQKLPILPKPFGSRSSGVDNAEPSALVDLVDIATLERGRAFQDDEDDSQRFDAALWLIEAARQSAPSTIRNVSPSIGGLRVDTFEWNSQPASAEIASHRMSLSQLL